MSSKSLLLHMVTLKKLEEFELHKCLEIYNYYVQNSTATFHLAPITKDEFVTLLAYKNAKYPIKAVYENKKLIGFCYLGQFRKKEAYDITAEITLYIEQGSTKKGIGKVVLSELENDAKAMGITNLIGVITEENKSSIKLFERCGYNKAAQLKKVGVKFGKALDVTWYQKEL